MLRPSPNQGTLRLPNDDDDDDDDDDDEQFPCSFMCGIGYSVKRSKSYCPLRRLSFESVHSLSGVRMCLLEAP